MGCSDYEPLTDEQRQAIDDAATARQQKFEEQVAMYKETAEDILKAGARVRSRQLVDLVEAHHEPYLPAIKEAVRRITLSGEYGDGILGQLGVQDKD